MLLVQEQMKGKMMEYLFQRLTELGDTVSRTMGYAYLQERLVGAKVHCMALGTPFLNVDMKNSISLQQIETQTCRMLLRKRNWKSWRRSCMLH